MVTEDRPPRQPRTRRRLRQHEQAQPQRAERGPADAEAWDRALRRRFRRAVAAAAVGFLVIPVAATAMSLLQSGSTWLLDHGSKVAGKVVEVYTPQRGAATITVDYPVGDVRLDLPGGARLVARTVALVRGRYSFLRNGPVEARISGEVRRLALALPHHPKGPYVIPLRVPRGSRWTAGR